MKDSDVREDGETITNGQHNEADYTPGADQARMIASWVSNPRERAHVYRAVRDILNAAPLVRTHLAAEGAGG